MDKMREVIVLSYYVRLVQLIIHLVLVTFTAVATQLAVRVLLHVVHAPASTRVSVVIEIVIVPALVSLIKVIAVPIGKATEELAGIVHVRAVVSVDGWYMCFPASVSTSVYAAL